MKRTLDQWRGMKPEAVVAGSPAQVLFCIRDAQADILEMARVIEFYRAAQTRDTGP